MATDAPPIVTVPELSPPDVADAPATPSLAGDVKIVDMFPEVERMLESGTAQFSRALVDTVQAQIECTTAELMVLERVNTLAAGEYSKLHDGVANVERFYRGYSAEVERIRPYLRQIDELDATVRELEKLAAQLLTTSKRLESEFADLTTEQMQ